MEFSQYLTKNAADIEQALDRLLPKPSGPQAPIMEAVRYAALGGGKRLRPFLLIETTRMLGGDLPAAMQVGCALECLHVYSLVHDDLPCMDDDDLRRGKPTVHKAYDTAIATLAGDALLTQSFEILSEADLSAECRLSLISSLTKAAGMSGMIGGQVIDIMVAEMERDEALITNLQALKTGALIEYAVQAGGVIAGATSEQLAALSAYARDLGLAFQIQDDILDVTGDAATVGKAVGKDKNLGKATFVSILGLKGAVERAKALGEQAKSYLAPWGKEAQILRDTMDFVLARSH